MVAVVRSRDTAPLPASSVNSPANRLVPDFATPASPLQSTLLRPFTSVHSKGLPENLSGLQSTLTKTGGGGSPLFVTTLELSPSLIPSISFQINRLRTLCTNQPASKRRIFPIFMRLRTLAKIIRRGWCLANQILWRCSAGAFSSLFLYFVASLLRYFATAAEQLRQLLLPQHRPGVRTVAVRLLAFGNHRELSVLQAFRFALCDSEPWRIDKIVRRIHPHHVRRDFLEARRRIVIPRRIHLIQKVVRVHVFRPRRKIVRKEFVGGIARRQRFLHRNRRAAGNNQKIERHAHGRLRLLFIFAAFPFRIFADRVHHHLAPNAVAPGNLHRQTRHRHQRVHKIRIRLAPHERVHASHRRPKNQPQMLHAEAARQQQMMSRHHVVVVVRRKMRVHSVARLGRFPVSNSIRQNHKIFRHVERLPRPVQFICKLRRQELRTRSARPMKNQNGVRHSSLRIPLRRPQRPVMQLQLRQRFPRPKLEIVRNVIAFFHNENRLFLSESRNRGDTTRDTGNKQANTITLHVWTPSPFWELIVKDSSRQHWASSTRQAPLASARYSADR